MDQKNIRNFAIIAHIDHGKSTLADRLLELTGTIEKRKMQAQILDFNPIERERGITIKLAPVRMKYKVSKRSNVSKASKETSNASDTIDISETSDTLDTLTPDTFILNLIDTPGHVDFSYEVSRSLAACEGALLVVDATQGVQAQTLAHLTQARKHNLKIIPIINKIDIPVARTQDARRELIGLGFKDEEIMEISAKTGENVEQVPEAIVERIPSPKGDKEKPLRALVFSSQYNTHKGVIVFVRIVDGYIDLALKGQALQSYAGSKLLFMATGANVIPVEIGHFSPSMTPVNALECGSVGYIATGMKNIKYTKVGDTVTISNIKNQKSNTHSKDLKEKKKVTPDTSDTLDTSDTFDPSTSSAQALSGTPDPSTSSGQAPLDTVQPLAGYIEPKPMVYIGLFPIDADELSLTRDAMEKLRLSDSAFTFRPISSKALGNGFQCGFLGLLHAEVVQERILREFGLTMIATAPSVEYKIRVKDKRSEIREQIQGTRDKKKEKLLNIPLNTLRKQPGIREKNGGEMQTIHSAAEFPDPSSIEAVYEPIMEVKIYSPKRYVGAIMKLVQDFRGEYIDLNYEADNAVFTYLIPLSDMIVDFFDRLKSVTEGYASLDYEYLEHSQADVVKIDILLNRERVDALCFLAIKSQAEKRGREIVERLVKVIPRQQFAVPVQAAIGGKIIARANIKAFRKDVTAKLYGGDRTRKDKLLNKQKKGKAKMKRIGSVEIPQKAFFEVLKRD